MMKIIVFCMCITMAFSEAIATVSSTSENRPAAPFKVLFSNDFTNTHNCTSPYRPKGASWRPEFLAATVDETAGTGIEVHMLQPAHTWVPWWQSNVYSMREHYDWWYSRYGNYPVMLEHEYILEGGDPVEDFVKRCRKHGIIPFVSLRLNDLHHLEHTENANNTQGPHAISRFYAENPDYRIGKGPFQTYPKVSIAQNWAIPEVRQHKFAFIEEICENYDIAGLELDFMRHWGFFHIGETSSRQRSEIMTGFIRNVRNVLNRTAKDGQYRWLVIRIPCFIPYFDTMGIDLPAMAAAGVDMVNVSPSYFTIQQNDMAHIKKMIPDTPVYIEMCHTTRVGQVVGQGYDAITFRRTTDIQYYTTAHLAYSRGLDGVSVFNFVYYREFGDNPDARGPWNEPPFHIFANIGDPDWVARQPQHYILRVNKPTRISETGSSPRLQNAQFPETLSAGESAVFKMDMAPPADGWKKAGRLRIQGSGELGDSVFRARFNGVLLESTSDVSEPYDNPYPPLLGTPEMHRGWMVPAALVRDGINEIVITMITGDTPKTIVFVDVVIE